VATEDKVNAWDKAVLKLTASLTHLAVGYSLLWDAIDELEMVGDSRSERVEKARKAIFNAMKELDEVRDELREALGYG